jgi:AmmeMemoRadiSam system protein A
VLARDTIVKALNKEKFSSHVSLYDALNEKRGVFVTLETHGEMRGCIGNIIAADSIYESVVRNAINAAFRDSRFFPLTKEELDDVEIEISVLTTPKDLKFKDYHELLKLLKPEYGVILENSGYSAVFLPQVWEQLPDKEEFLSHLSMKAGLSADAWKDKKTKIKIFEVQSFKD